MALTIVQQIRFLMGDKDANTDGVGDVYGITDDEINFAYGENESTYLAAATCLRAAASKLAISELSQSAATWSKDTRGRVAAMNALADKFEAAAPSEPYGVGAEIALTDAAVVEILDNKAIRESS